MSRVCLIALAFVTVAGTSSAQTPDYTESYFTARLGPPRPYMDVPRPDGSMLKYMVYTGPAGENVDITFDSTGRAVGIQIFSPRGPMKGWDEQNRRLAAIRNLMDTLVPVIHRGRVCRTLPTAIGNCSNVTVQVHELVVLRTNLDACYPPWLSIEFRRNVCPE